MDRNKIKENARRAQLKLEEQKRQEQQARREQEMAAAYENAKKQREEQIENAKNAAKKQKAEIERKRKLHLFVSSIILIITLSVIIAIYPNPVVTVSSVILIVVFFCIGISYQKAITQLLILAVCAIAILQTFYFLLNN